jgi:hypothetical protein
MKRYAVVVLAFFLAVSCNEKKQDGNDTGAVLPPRDSIVKPNNEPSTNNPYTGVDLSPMDMSYFPVDYPKLKMANAGVESVPRARVIYSRPHLQGRHIFHEVLKYGEPWRMGANEATELQLFKDATIQSKAIKAGRYILYCIPQQKEWTIVLNNNTDSWGLQQDASRDAGRFTVPVEEKNQSLEFFTMVFEGTGNNASLLMAWDNVEVRLPISFE